jgi:hypothetical protein
MDHHEFRIIPYAGLVGALLTAMVQALATPFWWVIPALIGLLAALALLSIIVLTLASCWMAKNTDVSEWSLTGWKRGRSHPRRG